MRRVLFHLGRRPVLSYPAMLALGATLGILVAMQLARGTPLPRERLLPAMLLLLAVALAGGRALSWLYERQRAAAMAGRPLRPKTVGVSLYGGLLFALPVSLPLLPWFGLSAAGFWDLAGVAMLIGVAIGRLGCWMTGCCAGRPTSSRWGLVGCDIHGRLARRVPVQLLDAAWAAIVLGALAWLWPRRPFDGAVITAAMALYAAGRFVLEPWRDKPDRLHGRLLQRRISAVLLATALLTAGLGWYFTVVDSGGPTMQGAAGWKR